jgi:DHA1 family bicyclomycin/chloramphenicol resistance-like MFS transporter
VKRSKPEALNACLMLLVIVAQATLATFLPAMPAVANELNVSASAVDRTLTFYMAGYAVSMALTGALTTRVDLRRVQLGALIVHVLASFAVVLAPSINFLAGARVVQALGAGVATVLARIYVQELFSEERQLAALTRLSTAIALTPALSPLIAGMLLEVFSWRLVLLGVGVLGAGTLLLAQQVLPASASGSGDGERGLRQAISSCRYWWFTAGISLAWCVYFSFTTYSSHALQVNLGLTPALYGLLYSLVVVGYVIGSTTARKLGEKLSLERMLAYAGLLAAGATGTMVLGTELAPHEPLVLVVPMAVAMIGVGAAFPVCQAGMLRTVGSRARSAAGLFFFIQMASGALYTGVLSLADPTSPGKLALVVFAPALGLVLLVAAERLWNHTYGRRGAHSASIQD